MFDAARASPRAVTEMRLGALPRPPRPRRVSNIRLFNFWMMSLNSLDLTYVVFRLNPSILETCCITFDSWNSAWRAAFLGQPSKVDFYFERLPTAGAART
jgi:hypothetical protein